VSEIIAAPVIVAPTPVEVAPTPVEVVPQVMPGSTFQTVLPPMANPIIAPVMQMTAPMPVMTTPAPTIATNNQIPVAHKSSSIKTFAIFAVLA